MIRLFYRTMCISILLILLLISSIKELNAQNNISIRAGLNNSSLYDMKKDFEYGYGIGNPEFDNKLAFYLGFSYYRFSKKLILLESSLNICSKFVSLHLEDGGLGDFITMDADYKLYYADISIYPAIYFGNRLKIVGSIRPNIGLMFASSHTGERTIWSRVPDPNEPRSITTPVSGSGKNEFSSLSVDLALNIIFVYAFTEKIGILLECQYSRGLNNICNAGEFGYNCNNILIGTGLIVRIPGNRNSVADS